jgi:hypothetical protein
LSEIPGWSLVCLRALDTGRDRDLLRERVSGAWRAFEARLKGQSGSLAQNERDGFPGRGTGTTEGTEAWNGQ